MKSYRQTEAQFQTQVVQLARLMGWAVYHPWLSVRSTAGWPDLALVRNGRLILAELKTDTGKLTAAQEGWLNELSKVKGIEVSIWRPGLWPEIEAVLTAQE